ncbi:hypothetical protein COL35_29185 [Bacillus toyonensis]|uniref:hypothetical protein n=1 Tax=Bacillus toyonensis TaxID=155322 RepID=UPI000BF4054B|nr:hypothetical protein [Bacillus toyonensis]PFX63065.1 hypothetical protein COL35_29185 [Bacillus toyonensis]
MASNTGTSNAVTEATRLNEIGFPEFTTKLITDTFDAIISANLRQTESYLDLIKETQKNLSTFINDTKDDISGEMILQYLVKILPAVKTEEEGEGQKPISNTGTKVATGYPLDDKDVETLKNAVKINEVPANNTSGNTNTSENNNDPGNHNLDIPPGEIQPKTYQTILDAVAKRISADKYTLLKEMVNQGLIRLVVENGEIETKLTFKTFGSDFYSSHTTDYNKTEYTLNASARTGSFFSFWARGSAHSSYNNIRVSTADTTNTSSTNSSVEIFGHVKLNFKTDYLPLKK